MAWATLANGAAGDEVWLDRSWDEGVSWPGGSSLGRISRAGRARRRPAPRCSHTRDPRGLLYGGAVRACGRGGRRGQSGSCTAWARPATEPRRRRGRRADVGLPARHGVVAVELVELRGRRHHGDGLDEAHRAHRLPLDRRPHLRGQQGRRSRPGVKSSDADRGPLHQPRHRRLRMVGARLDRGVRPDRRCEVPDEAVTIANYVNGFWDTGALRRRRVVGPRAHVQERGHQRPVRPPDGRAAQPAAGRHRLAEPGNAPAGTGSPPAA